jgi:MFS superfamily sulfate permease-like transporter
MLAAIAIPEQLATARLAGFPPAAGLYAFAAGTLAFAVFGTNRYVSVGADSTTAPIVAASLGALTAFGGAASHDLASALALAVAIILVVVGLLRAGWVADLLSVPVTTGFLAGISAHIIIGQLPSLLGITEPSGPLLLRFFRIIFGGAHPNGSACALGIGVAVLTLTAMRLNERIPGALIGLTAAACAVATFGLRAHGVAVLGELHPALPALALPPIPAAANWTALAPVAVIVASVCALQTSVVVRSFPSSGGVTEEVNGDFAAVGFGCMLAAFAGTFPVNASPPRTAIVESAGGRSQVAGLVAIATLAVVVALCSRFAADVPQAALAGVLIVIGIRLFRWNEMRRIARCSRREIQLVIAGALLVIVLPIQTGMLLAIMLSLAHGVSLVMWPPSVQLFQVRGTTVWWPATGERDVVDVPGVLVFAPAAPVNFTNAPSIRERLLTLLGGRHPPATLVVIEASAVSDVDYTGSQMLQTTIRELRGRGVDVAVARLIVQHAQQAAQRSGLIAELGADHIFLSVQDALAALGHA